MIRVLKLPAYRRLLGAYALSELAWWIGSVSLSLLVYRRTGSALGSAAFFLCAQFLPALASPLLVARLDQRAMNAVFPALYGLEALAYLALAGVASRFVLAPVLALALADGVVALAARSLARAATVAVTSPAGLLRDGNALSNAVFSICFTVGPAVGGAMVAAGGVSIALLINAGLFTLIALTFATARGLPGAATERKPTTGRFRAAVSHARRHPAIRALLGLQAAALLFFTISIPVEVVLAQHTLHAGAGGYGALLGTWGAGAIAGSAIYARWRKLPPRTLITLAAASLGLGFVVMAAAPSLGVALVGAALGGIGNGVEAVAMRTALQEVVEGDWMARIMSLYESLFNAVPGAGILLGGGITALWSPRIALAVGGAGALAMAVAAAIVLRDQVMARSPGPPEAEHLGPRPAGGSPQPVGDPP